MSENNITTLMGGLWFLSGIALTGLFISAAAQGELTAGHIALALVLLGLAVGGTFLLFSQKESESGQAKAKRHTIEDMLHNMSAEEIAELKQRLTDGEGQEDRYLDYLGDDGELKLRR